MKIYELGYDANNYLGCYLKNCNLTEEQNYEFSCSNKLSFVPEFTIEYDRESKTPIGDFINCWDNSSLRIISEKAKGIFESNLDNGFELFPVRDEYGNSVYVFNNLTCIDALDPEKTEYAYFKNTKARVKKYSFKTDLSYPMIFQIFLEEKYVLMSHFVTEAFVNLVNAAGLKGFKFTEVWNRDAEYVKD